MGKNFLTLSEVKNKIGANLSGNSFVQKSQLLTTNLCDETKLTKYNNQDYVIDDDIIKKVETITYEYTLTVSNLSVKINAAGSSSVTISVTSTRQKYINGVKTGNPENIDFIVSPSNSWIKASKNNNQVIISCDNNTTSNERSGGITIIQFHENTYGKNTIIQVSQYAGVLSHRYEWTFNPTILYLNYNNKTGSVKFQRNYVTIWNDVATNYQPVSGSLTGVKVIKNGTGSTNISASIDSTGTIVNLSRINSPTYMNETYYCQVSIPSGDVISNPYNFQVILQN